MVVESNKVLRSDFKWQYLVEVKNPAAECYHQHVGGLVIVQGSQVRPALVEEVLVFQPPSALCTGELYASASDVIPGTLYSVGTSRR